MKVLFLIAFGGGLAIAVYAMLHGVERTRATEVTRPAPYLNLPGVAALLVALGAVGYLLVRNSSLQSFSIGVIALVAGALGWVGMTILMAKWALRPEAAGGHGDADEIQGQPGVVTVSIGVNEAGAVRYSHLGHSHEVPARNIDAEELPAGTEIVIDRFDGGVAIVEKWASVEKRL